LIVFVPVNLNTLSAGNMGTRQELPALSPSSTSVSSEVAWQTAALIVPLKQFDAAAKVLSLFDFSKTAAGIEPSNALPLTSTVTRLTAPTKNSREPEKRFSASEMEERFLFRLEMHRGGSPDNAFFETSRAPSEDSEHSSFGYVPERLFPLMTRV
jgi:hypothetical protein